MPAKPGHSTPTRTSPTRSVLTRWTSSTHPPVHTTPAEGEFYNDWWFYEWGKTERKYSYAAWDADADLLSDEELGVFNDVIGVEVGTDKCPEIILLAQRAVTDASRANKAAKKYFQRERPFVYYKEPSFTPERDEHLSG